MKFTKEQAFESLKRELTNNDRKPLRMSTKTLDKLTDILIGEFADEEIGLPDFCSKAMTILNVVNDNIGKDKSDFIKSWNAEHPDDPKPEKPEDKPKPAENSELASLKAEIEALKKAHSEAETKQKLTAKRTALAAKMREKGITDKEWLDAMLSEVNITEELDEEAKADSLLKLYNKSKANVPPVQTPGSPTGANNDEIPEALKRAKELIKKEKEFARIS